MLRKKMYQILEAVCAAPTLSDKIRVLQVHDHKSLRGYLKMAFDKNLRWALPEGTPPFKPWQQLFVNLLESMDPKDAAFLCNFVKDHKIPEGINENVIKQAFRDW